LAVRHKSSGFFVAQDFGVAQELEQVRTGLRFDPIVSTNAIPALEACLGQEVRLMALRCAYACHPIIEDIAFIAQKSPCTPAAIPILISEGNASRAFETMMNARIYGHPDVGRARRTHALNEVNAGWHRVDIVELR